MVIWIRRKLLLEAVLTLAVFCGMTAVLWQSPAAVPAAAESASVGERLVYVVDAGHGGEDGGAVAGDGTVESGLNLAIALSLNDILRFCGQETRMTRSGDDAVYSEGAATLRQKKVSDLKNRVELVNQTKNGVLVSIHQNALPASPAVHGAQVFYNTVPGSDELAAKIQEVLNGTVNAGNEKQCKKIPDSIYLMKNVTTPAVLIECGFLSNSEETAMLRNPEYQKKLAASIAGGVLAEREKETE